MLCARILYMTTLSLAEARANLSKLVESAVTTHERFEVTRNGDRVAVLLGADDYDSLLETLDILSNPDEVAAIRAAMDGVIGDDRVTVSDLRTRESGRQRFVQTTVVVPGLWTVARSHGLADDI